MSKKRKMFAVNLQLFNDGGAGTGAAPAGSGGESGTAANTRADTVLATPTENATQGSPAPEADKSAAFEALIKGEYKDEYAKKMQDTVQKRYGKKFEAADRLKALTPSLELIAKKYGVDPSDVAALSAAIQEDDAYYEQEAMQRGMDVEQFKAVRKMELENEALRRQMRESEERANADRIYGQWLNEAEAVKAIYPAFDLSSELQNRDFINMLQSGVGVKAAYQAIHIDEIIPAAMQFTSQQVAEQMSNKIIAGGARPQEGAASNSSPAVVKTDVSKFTDQQMTDYLRRIASGEIISFG